MNTASGSALLSNLLLFGRLLRVLGVDVNSSMIIHLAQGLGHIDLSRRNDFYHAARSLLVHHRQDMELFDLAFALFWRKHGAGPDGSAGGSVTVRDRRPKIHLVPPSPGSEKSPPPAGKEDPRQRVNEEVVVAARTYSAREVLKEVDFAQLSPDELVEVKQLMRELSLQVVQKRTHRFHSGSKRRRINIRGTLRQSFKTGGEIMTWAHREHRYKPRTLVVLADISGSMERYTRLLLHFVFGLHQAHRRRVEAFLFSTRLTRITRELKTRDIDAAVKKVSASVPDWAGGTRIGEALKRFNFIWGRRVLGGGAIVLIISDGWDRGELDLLELEMDRLHRSCHRLIWLNPLLGSPAYEPLALGIKTALPHVDDFLPVHNLASLADLGQKLAALNL